MGLTGTQTVKTKFSKLTPMEDKTLTIGFPPGTGNIVILNISFTDN